MNYFKDLEPDQRQSVLDKLNKIKHQSKDTVEDLRQLSEEELKVLEIIRARQMLPIDEVVGMADITQDIYDGLQPRVSRGNLGLNRVGEAITEKSGWEPPKADPFGMMLGAEHM